MEFTVKNAWIGQSAGRWLEIYAGGQRITPGGDTATKPAVRVYTITVGQLGEEALVEVGTYVDTGVSGLLSVTAVTAQTMTLRTDHGQTAHFSLQDLRFV